MLEASLVSTENDLYQIAALSQANHVSQVSEEAEEGFVTWVYTPGVLKTLHAIVPSIIVRDGDVLAGYALSLTRACAEVYRPMREMMESISGIPYKGKPLGEQRMYIMGQICVDSRYRGQGVVEQLYRFHRDRFSPDFDVLVTEISVRNPRSLRAHEKAGFRTIHTYDAEDGRWQVVAWDWA